MSEVLPEPIPLDDAQQRLLDLVYTQTAIEKVPTVEAAGRVLARDCLATRTQPPADLSAMDGYALRSEDVPGPWQLVGESAAGHPFSGMVNKGEAVRISTGAEVPLGADTVLIRENAERTGDRLALTGAVPQAGANIRRKGFDFAAGNPVLHAGKVLSPAQIALAFAAGHAELEVGVRPTLAILDSGDELSLDPANCGDGEIPASNGVMLEAMLGPYSQSVRRLGPVRDDPEALSMALNHANDVDVLITSGGASVGDHDLVRPALEAWGADIEFWRVKMKPGKPIMVARRGKQFIIGLPGNPVSAYVGAFLFVVPLLKRFAGASDALPQIVGSVLKGSLPATGPRLELARGVWNGTNVTPVSGQDSSGLSALAQSNALIRRNPQSDAIEDGSPVSIFLIQYSAA